MCAVAENLAPHRDLPVEPDLQKMLSTMRELVADTGGTVHFGRRNAENGEVCTDSVDREETNLRMTEHRMRVKEVGDQLASKTDEEKAQYALDLKEKGNAAYAKDDYEIACNLYIRALTACSLASEGTSAVSRSKVAEELQLPVLCNLAACMHASPTWPAVEDAQSSDRPPPPPLLY